MDFMNVGAQTRQGERFRTKKALIEALKSDPAAVHFDTTSMFSRGAIIKGTEVPERGKLSVVGPCPYTDRRWYAAISRKPDGSLRIQ